MRPVPLRTVRTAAVAATAVALGASVLTAPPATAVSAQPQPHARATTLRIGTFNIDSTVSTATWKAAASRFLPTVDIAGMQEVAGKEKKAAITSMPGIGSFIPGTGNQDPIMWNTSRYRLVSGREARTAAGRRVENGHGSGYVHQKSTIASVARLSDVATGEPLSVINVHLLPGAVNRGKKVKGRRLRFRMYRDQVANLSRIVATEQAWSGGRVWVLGDFNDNYVSDRLFHKHRLAYSTLRRGRMICSWEARPVLRGGHGSGTRSGSYLDQIWAMQHAASVTVLRQSQFRVGEHYPLVSTYSVP